MKTPFKIVPITPPGAIVDNTAYTTATVDTKGFSHLQVIVHLGATDIAMAAMKLQESDASNMSNPSDVLGTVGGTDFTLPTDGAEDTFGIFNVEIGGGRKRYIDLVATAGDGSAGTYMTAFAILSRPHVAPITAADRGAEFEVTAFTPNWAELPSQD